MIRAGHPRRVGLQETPQQAQVRASPPAAALTVVITGAAPLALPTPLLRAFARTDRDHDRLALPVELHAVNHGRLLDPEHACPYRGVAHAVPRSKFWTLDSPKPRQGRRVARSGRHRGPKETIGEPFNTWCANAHTPELERLAKTIEAWWPEVLGFLQTDITNAATEATNRTVKTAARTAYGFRNLNNQRRRVRFACTRTHRRATDC